MNMLFAFIGLVALVFILGSLSILLVFICLHGGEEFSPLPAKEYRFVVPLALFFLWLWAQLLTHSPFTLTVQP